MGFLGDRYKLEAEAHEHQNSGINPCITRHTIITILTLCPFEHSGAALESGRAPQESHVASTDSPRAAAQVLLFPRTASDHFEEPRVSIRKSAPSVASSTDLCTGKVRARQTVGLPFRQRPGARTAAAEARYSA